MSEPEAQWFKSSFSGNGGCVEVKVGDEQVSLRDSKDPLGPVLNFTWHEWDVFLRGVDNAEFNLPSSPQA